ncbi:hypothetical protein MMC27_002545 [Xylographa pallens]|nr:hypothetical protein [Xylographa pallens]
MDNKDCPSMHTHESDSLFPGPLSLFERLPWEVRNTIYQFSLLVSAVELRKARPSDNSDSSPGREDQMQFQHHKHGDEVLCAALLRVSKTISKEAILFLYSENIFRIPNRLFDPFLAEIGTTNADYLRDLNLVLATEEIWDGRFQLVEKEILDLDYVPELPNLRRITLSHYPLSDASLAESSDEDLEYPTMDVTLLANYVQRYQPCRPALSVMFMRSEKDQNHISVPHREVTITEVGFKTALNVGAHRIELQSQINPPSLVGFNEMHSETNPTRYFGFFRHPLRQGMPEPGTWHRHRAIMTIQGPNGDKLLLKRDLLEYRNIKLVTTMTTPEEEGQPVR